MKTIYSPKLEAISRHDDEARFWEWLSFYRRNGLFENLERSAKQGNVTCVAVLGDWPPTHPGEWQTFENDWWAYRFNSEGATTIDAQQAVRRRFALPSQPLYARSRMAAEKELEAIRAERDERARKRVA